VRIRPYAPGDRRKVLDLLAGLSELYPRSDLWLQRQLLQVELGSVHILLALHANDVVGALIEKRKPRGVKLATIWVRSDIRRRGVASTLVAARMKCWRLMGQVVYCTAPVMAGNGALAFLLAQGFRIREVHHGRYFEKRDDAFLEWSPASNSIPVRELLISIRREFAEEIFAGSKRFELRRRRPGIPPSTRCWVYVPLPVGAVLGRFHVGVVQRRNRGDQLIETACGAHMSWRAPYLADMCSIWAIEIVNPERLPTPLAVPAGCRAPQMYSWLSQLQIRQLHLAVDIAAERDSARLRVLKPTEIPSEQSLSKGAVS
jgi:predicted transcriptional regulator/ribosomal protein S18 acetylase RimI-like enzyme